MAGGAVGAAGAEVNILFLMGVGVRVGLGVGVKVGLGVGVDFLVTVGIRVGVALLKNSIFCVFVPSTDSL